MIVAGFGFRQGAGIESLRDAFARAGGMAQAFAVPADKAEAPAIVAFAVQNGVPLVKVEPDVLSSQSTVTQSSVSKEARGTGSVAEAAAIAAAGKDARLLAPRVVSDDRMATCALAEGRRKGGAQ